MNTSRDSNVNNIPEYEIYLQTKYDELRNFFSKKISDKDLLELLLLQITQIIGLSMDKLFFFVNKPESIEFVKSTKNQLYKWLGKIEELLTRNSMIVSQDLNKDIEDGISSIHVLQSIIIINFITYDS